MKDISSAWGNPDQTMKMKPLSTDRWKAVVALETERMVRSFIKGSAGCVLSVGWEGAPEPNLVPGQQVGKDLASILDDIIRSSLEDSGRCSYVPTAALAQTLVFIQLLRAAMKGTQGDNIHPRHPATPAPALRPCTPERLRGPWEGKGHNFGDTTAQLGGQKRGSAAAGTSLLAKSGSSDREQPGAGVSTPVWLLANTHRPHKLPHSTTWDNESCSRAGISQKWGQSSRAGGLRGARLSRWI